MKNNTIPDILAVKRLRSETLYIFVFFSDEKELEFRDMGYDLQYIRSRGWGKRRGIDLLSSERKTNKSRILRLLESMSFDIIPIINGVAMGKKPKRTLNIMQLNAMMIIAKAIIC